MSIYATSLDLDADDHDDQCSRWVETTDHATDHASGQRMMYDDAGRVWRYDGLRECTCELLGPLVYQGSHVNPQPGDPRGGNLDLGYIPDFCHPDVLGTDKPGRRVEFLRISIDEDPATYHGGQPGSATVVLDEAHVCELAEALTDWLTAGERE